MTLRQLANILPGYVTLMFHTDKEGWNMTAGMVAADEDLPEAYVISAVPLAPYTMEVSIRFEEVTDENKTSEC